MEKAFQKTHIKLVLFLALATGILLLNGCGSSLKVVSDYNGGLDFSQYKTYNFLKPDPDSVKMEVSKRPTIINQLNQRRLEAAIDEEMYLRGYSMSETPDILISYYVKIEDKTETTATTYGNYGSPYYGGYGYYGYYGGYGYGNTYTDVRTYDYKYGTLIIDLVDAKDNELIWYGAASKAMEDVSRNPEATINYIVTKMFNNYRFLAGQKEPARYPPK